MPRRGHGERGEAALEVHRAAAVDEAAPDQARERVDRPEVALDAHDVLVAGQQEWLLGRVLGAQARDEVGLARRRRRHDLDLEAERREPRLQQLGDLRLVARRVGGVGPDQLLQQRDDLAVGPVVLRLRHAREERASDQERHQYTRQPPRTHAPASQRGRRGGPLPAPVGPKRRASSVRIAQASSTASRGEPQMPANRGAPTQIAPRTERWLPHALIATAFVVVLPALAVWMIVPRGEAALLALSVPLGMLLSVLAASARRGAVEARARLARPRLRRPDAVGLAAAPARRAPARPRRDAARRRRRRAQRRRR